MRILIVEDEDDFTDRVSDAIKETGGQIELQRAAEVGLWEPFGDKESIEEQLLTRVRNAQSKFKFDLVLLDSDLSRIRTGIAQSLLRQAFQEIGVPVCRYRKRHSTTIARELQDLRRTAREGASAVWVPSELVQLPHLASKLVPWLLAVGAGFADLRTALSADTSILFKSQGPAGVLALILKRGSAKADFLGYTAQNFFFFGPPAGEDAGEQAGPQIEVLSTRLGYWLLNYILRFPGPILSVGATAAYLNVRPEDIQGPVVDLIAPARYTGPFATLENFYWRDELADVLDAIDGDLANAPALKGTRLNRVDPGDPGSSAYFCVLTQTPIAEADAAPNPDWIPPGAQLARIRGDLFEQLGPMLSV